MVCGSYFCLKYFHAFKHIKLSWYEFDVKIHCEIPNDGHLAPPANAIVYGSSSECGVMTLDLTSLC